MSVVYGLEYKKSKKRANELKTLLLTLDSICDQMYNNLHYDGIWDCLMKLEDVRIKYYVEYYEHNKIVRLKGAK